MVLGRALGGPARRTRRAGVRAVTRTFLFSDLRDYTQFTEARGDAAAVLLLRNYRVLVRREVARHAGAEVKTEGDSFYVVFDAPSSALDCAVSILARAAERDTSDPAAPLRIGIGLHVGEAVPHEQQYVGVAVNIAARLAAKADAGELLVSDALRALVRSGARHAMRDRGALRLKGIAEPVRAWSVVWDEGHAPDLAPMDLRIAPTIVRTERPGTLCPELVGRDSELAQVRERLTQAAAGTGGMLLIAGEAGVGKTAFARRAQVDAAEQGFRVLTGLSDASGAGLPYAPFVSAIRSAFRSLPRGRLVRTLHEIAPALAQLFPELEAGAVGVQASSGLERHRLSIAFHDLFLSLAREPAVVIVLEDLHWADEASLELLQYLARELRDARVLILGTYRSDEMHRRHPLGRVLAAMHRERLVTRVELRRLGRDEIAEMIRLTFARAEPTSAEFTDAIYTRCGGNPFFAEELLRALAERGDIFVADGRWTRGGKTVEAMRIPDSIVEAIRARIERLDPKARTTLDAGAVVGLEFPADVLQVITAVDAARIELHLREAIDLQLVAHRSGGEEAYAFRHALTREVIYDDLLPSERKRLHRAVADALVATPAAEPAMLAVHLIAAGEGQRAVPHLLEAGARAFRADAPREAAAHYGRALEIGVPEDELPGILERLAGAYRYFDVTLSAKAAEEAEARYRARGDPYGASRSLLIASAAWFAYVDGARAHAQARAAYEAVAEREPSVELGRATAHLATLRTRDGAWREGIALADRALALGERFDDQWTIANALIAKGRAMRFSSTDDALPLIMRGLDLAIASDLAETALPGYTIAALVMGYLRRPRDERLAFVARGIEYARRHGVEEMAQLEYMQAALVAASGDWDGALAVIRRSTQADRQYLRALEAVIVRGREGPRAALPLALEVAERGLRAQFAWDFIWAMPQAAIACILVGDEAAAHSWLGRLRARLDDDDDARTQLRVGTAGIASSLVAALLCDEPAWLVDVESAVAGRTDPAVEIQAAEARAVASVMGGDEASAARAIETLFEPGGEEWGMVGSGGPWFTVICVREARRRGLVLGPEWAAIIERAREFAERAGARWYLQELSASGAA